MKSEPKSKSQMMREFCEKQGIPMKEVRIDKPMTFDEAPAAYAGRYEVLDQDDVPLLGRGIIECECIKPAEPGPRQ